MSTELSDTDVLKEQGNEMFKGKHCIGVASSYSFLSNASSSTISLLTRACNFPTLNLHNPKPPHTVEGHYAAATEKYTAAIEKEKTAVLLCKIVSILPPLQLCYIRGRKVGWPRVLIKPFYRPCVLSYDISQ